VVWRSTRSSASNKLVGSPCLLVVAGYSSFSSRRGEETNEAELQIMKVQGGVLPLAESVKNEFSADFSSTTMSRCHSGHMVMWVLPFGYPKLLYPVHIMKMDQHNLKRAHLSGKMQRTIVRKFNMR
jgi:hypothetical protein